MEAVTGPEHYREGEERMRASDYQRQQAGDDGDLTTAMHEALERVLRRLRLSLLRRPELPLSARARLVCCIGIPPMPAAPR